MDPAVFDQQLAQHIAQLPALVDDPAYLVFADWLQSHGHPWGELVVLQHRAAHATTAAERDHFELEALMLLDRAGPQILGDLPHDAKRELVWHLGFVRRARLSLPPDKTAVLAATRTLLARPCARMIETLVLDPQPDRFVTTHDYGDTSNVIDPWPDWDDLGPVLHERLPHVGFGGWPASPASAYVRMPSFDMISRWLRGLRHLELTGTWLDRREVLDLPDLIHLDLHFADARTTGVEALAASKLPMLERLSVGLGGSSACILDDVYPPDDYDEDDPDKELYPDHFSASDLENLSIHGVDQNIRGETLRRFLDAMPPRVTELGLSSSALNGELLGTLVAHPRIPKLRRLELAACTINDQTIPILLDAAGALGQIGAIDLSRNDISSRFTSRLSRALPNAVISEQNKSTPDFFMRYVATME